ASSTSRIRANEASLNEQGLIRYFLKSLGLYENGIWWNLDKVSIASWRLCSPNEMLNRHSFNLWGDRNDFAAMDCPIEKHPAEISSKHRAAAMGLNWSFIIRLLIKVSLDNFWFIVVYGSRPPFLSFGI